MTSTSFGVLGVRLRHGRGLWASSAVTLMNAHAAGCAGNVGRQIIRTSARIPSTRIARSAALKARQELRLYATSKNEHKLAAGKLASFYPIRLHMPLDYQKRPC